MEVGKLCGTNAKNFEQVKTWLANASQSWLLIVDNADNPDIDYALYFPSGNRGNILLTTRNPQCRGYETAGFEDLEHLDLGEATSLLLLSAEKASSYEEDQKAAETIVKTLASHTLAIIQAGALIKHHRRSLKEFPVLFRTQEERILKYPLTQEQSTYGNVFATFEISATHLESSRDQSAADALNLLQILGFIHFKDIPESMFFRALKYAIHLREGICRGCPQDEIYQMSELQISRLPRFMLLENDAAVDLLEWRWRELLSLLESYSFIKIVGNGEDILFSMHPLVHTWTRIRHGLASWKEGWRAAGSIIALSMWGVNYNMFHEKLRPHVVVYLDYLKSEYLADMTEIEIIQTHYKICCLLLHLRDITKLRILLDVLEKFEPWTAPRGESMIHVQSLKAYCLVDEKQPMKAIELLEQLMDAGHSNDLHVQRRLAEAYIADKRYLKAINLLENIVRIEEEKNPKENDGYLISQSLLAIAYLDNKQFEKAATLLERIVQIGRETLAPARLDRLASESNLGRAYIGIHQYEKAANILQQVLDIRRTILDVTDPYLLATQVELARAYTSMGSSHCAKAADLLEQVVEIRERILEPEDSDLLGSQHNLTTAYIKMGNSHCAKAAGLLEQVVEIRERILEPDDPKLLGSQYYLARAYNGMGSGHYVKAAELLEKVVEMQPKTLAPDNLRRLDLQKWLEYTRGRIQAEEEAKRTYTSAEELQNVAKRPRYS